MISKPTAFRKTAEQDCENASEQVFNHTSEMEKGHLKSDKQPVTASQDEVTLKQTKAKSENYDDAAKSELKQAQSWKPSPTVVKTALGLSGLVAAHRYGAPQYLGKILWYAPYWDMANKASSAFGAFNTGFGYVADLSAKTQNILFTSLLARQFIRTAPKAERPVAEETIVSHNFSKTPEGSQLGIKTEDQHPLGNDAKIDKPHSEEAYTNPELTCQTTEATPKEAGIGALKSETISQKSQEKSKTTPHKEKAKDQQDEEESS